MMFTRIATALALAVVTGFAASAEAREPDTFEEDYHPPNVIESPEWGAFEFRIGPYRPDAGDSFDAIFGSDDGWMFGLELDAQFIKIPYVGTAGLGAGWGWAKYSGKAQIDSGGDSSENEKLTLYPLSGMAVLRVDGLSKHLHVPLLLAGKVGVDVIRWSSEKGGVSEGKGISPGFRWAVQGAIDLNFIEPAAARELDEEWGINRSFLFFEYYGSRAEGKSIRLADRSFALGIGLIY